MDAMLLVLPLLAGAAALAGAPEPDLILHHARIVTVDPQFRIAEAMAVKGDRIVAVGAGGDVMHLAGPKTAKVDLAGRVVLPGLIDSHSHPPDAAMYEFDHPVPEMESIADVLAYVRSRAQVLGADRWIVIQQVFVTRLREQRFPTLAELDAAAPNNPVFFRTGPDAALNSLALKLSGIDEHFKVSDGQAGYIERDPTTGKPTGILRNCARFVKCREGGKAPTGQDRYDRLKALLAAYNEVGITGVTDRGASEGSIAVYTQLRDKGELTCRIFLTYNVDAQAPLEKIEAAILKAARHPLHKYDNMLWLRGVKVYLDGGMLTGSAYMRQPWGVSKIYGIADPEYRGLCFIAPGRLEKIARWSLENDLQPTAHCQGDGAVHALIDAYEAVNRTLPLRDRRPCISHSSFMSAEAIEKMRALGIVVDLQPAWLYLDGMTLLSQFGDGRLAYFHPYRTLFDRGVTVGGGSDHMQKLGSLRSINPYNPMLGMWIVLARQPRWTDKPLRPEQRITRQEAIRLYTINNAYLTFEERQKGSLEAGKLADFIVLDRDILTCPLDEVKDVKVRETWLGGKQVYRCPQ
jgi:hypothetical protein